MNTMLAKLRRGKYLPLLLGLLLFGNGFLHLCYHAPTLATGPSKRKTAAGFSLPPSVSRDHRSGKP